MRPSSGVGPIALTGAELTLYTVTQPTRLTDLLLTNTTAAPLTVSIYILPVATALADLYAVLRTVTVPPNDLIRQQLNVPMLSGDTIRSGPASGPGVNFRATVQEEF